VGGTATAGPIWVYNIPGMETRGTGYGTDSNTVRITGGDLDGLFAGSASAGTNFVLTRDFDLPGNWSPVGTGTDAAAFQGNFFGNGRTIAINGINPGPALGRVGLFGVANNALIRDLTVVYADMTVAGTTGINNVGGIAAQATGTTRILNSIARGATANATLAVTTGGTTRLGGIVGNMANTASIQNSLAALNVTLNAGGDHALFVGGVVGMAGGTAAQAVTLSDITATGTVSMNKTGGVAGMNRLGGIAGQLSHAYLRNGAFAGRIYIPATFDASAASHIGGLVGDFATRGLLDGGIATGDISVRSQGTSQVYLGGALGRVQGSSDASRVIVQNSVYSDGAIFLSARTSTQRIGGFVGSVFRFGEITGSHSRASSVSAYTAGGSLLFGGFAGQLVQTDVSNSSSASPVIVPATHTSTGAAQVGGFAGRVATVANIPSSLTDVFSTGSVYVHSRCTGGDRGIGGLVGFMVNGVADDPPIL